MERKAKQTVTTPLFSPNAQKPAKMKESLGEEPASWRARLHAYTCVPDCFPVVSDGCCLVALISQVFANVVVNLKSTGDIGYQHTDSFVRAGNLLDLLTEDRWGRDLK